MRACEEEIAADAVAGVDFGWEDGHFEGVGGLSRLDEASSNLIGTVGLNCGGVFGGEGGGKADPQGRRLVAVLFCGCCQAGFQAQNLSKKININRMIRNEC